MAVPRKCSFCLETEKELGYICAGPNTVHICETCVLLAVQMIKHGMSVREFQFDDAEKELEALMPPLSA